MNKVTLIDVDALGYWLGQVAEPEKGRDRSQAGYYQAESQLSGEAAPVWMGSGVSALGFQPGPFRPGDVDRQRAVFEGLDPRSEEARAAARAAIEAMPDGPVKQRSLRLMDQGRLVEEQPSRVVTRAQDDGTVIEQTLKPVAGADLTFSAPKDVSVLWALCGFDVARVVEQAHNEAVRFAVESYLEPEACRVRRGKGGVKQYVGSGFTAAAFFQRDSRNLDPQLHTHVVTANITQAPDGTWLSLDSKELMAHSKTAGAVYQAKLRELITEQLGIQFVTTKNGFAEMVGMPEEVKTLFSSRNAAAKKLAEEEGLDWDDPKVRDAMLLRTRNAKPEELRSTAEMFAQWRSEARAAGIDPDQLVVDLQVKTNAFVAERGHAADLIRKYGRIRELGKRLDDTQMSDLKKAWVVMSAFRKERRNAQSFESLEDRQLLLADRIRRTKDPLADVELQASIIDLLTTSQAVLTRRELIQGLINLGMTAEGSLAMADQLAAHPELVQSQHLGERGPEIGPDGRTCPTLQQQKFTSQALINAERRIEQMAVDGIGAARGVDRKKLEEVLEGPGASLDDGQRAMVEMVTGNHELTLVAGRAGTGKSHAMKVANQAWTAEGKKVYGCALAAKAAAGLQSSSGIESTTVARMLLDLDKGKKLKKHAVVVVDEVGMLDTRSLDRLAAHVRKAQGQLVLVGDPKQLASIEAGGMASRLMERYKDTLYAELTKNWRQQDAMERRTIDLLRDETTAAIGIARYARDGKLVVSGSAEETVATMVNAYFQAVDRGQDALMLAPTNRELDQLNDVAEAKAHQRGELGKGVEMGDRTWYGGMPVRCDRNDPTAGQMHGRTEAEVGVLNGTAGTIVGVVTVPVWKVKLESSLLNRRSAMTVRGAEPRRGEKMTPTRGPLAKHGGRVIDKPKKLREERFLEIEVIDEGPDGEEVKSTRLLSEAYVREHLSRGWAMSVHKAQGVTCDWMGALVDGNVEQKSLYVALSRAKHWNGMFTTNADLALSKAERERAALRAVQSKAGRSAQDMSASTHAEKQAAADLRHLVAERRDVATWLTVADAMERGGEGLPLDALGHVSIEADLPRIHGHAKTLLESAPDALRGAIAQIEADPQHPQRDAWARLARLVVNTHELEEDSNAVLAPLAGTWWDRADNQFAYAISRYRSQHFGGVAERDADETTQLTWAARFSRDPVGPAEQTAKRAEEMAPGSVDAEEVARQKARFAQMTAQLDVAVDEHVDAVQQPDWMPARPEAAEELAQWDADRRAIMRYRVRWGLTDEAVALGRRPHRPGPQRDDYDELREQLGDRTDPQLMDEQDLRRELRTLATRFAAVPTSREQKLERLHMELKVAQQGIIAATTPESEAMWDVRLMEMEDLIAAHGPDGPEGRRLDHERAQWLAEHGASAARYAAVDAQLRRNATAQMAMLDKFPPSWARERPSAVLGAERETWKRQVQAALDYRHRWGVWSNDDALGPRPETSGVQQREWDALTEDAARSVGLDRSDERGRGVSQGRELTLELTLDRAA